jgi:hypothetical protein
MNALEQATEDLLAVEFPDRPEPVDPSQYDDVYRDVLRSSDQAVQAALEDGMITTEAAVLILVGMLGLPVAEERDYLVAQEIIEQASLLREKMSKDLW